MTVITEETGIFGEGRAEIPGLGISSKALS